MEFNEINNFTLVEQPLGIHKFKLCTAAHDSLIFVTMTIIIDKHNKYVNNWRIIDTSDIIFDFIANKN